MRNVRGRRRGSNAYNPVDVHVGDRVRARRTLLGLSQPAVAQALGITFQQLQKYEKGGNRISAGRLYDLSQILEVDMDYFFEDMAQAVKNASPAQIVSSRSTKAATTPSRSEDPLHKRETLELVRAYYQISEPEIRGRLRKLFIATAGFSGG